MHTRLSAFKNIYQYITTKCYRPSAQFFQTENYIVADGLLFRLYETFIRRCLLVIPETHEHVIFQHYHDSLLGAQWSIEHFLHNSRNITFTICLIKLINMFLHVMNVKNKKPNDTRIDNPSQNTLII